MTTWNFDEAVSREGTNSVKYDLREDIFGRRDIIPMWVADMDFRTPDLIINKLRKRLDNGIFGYSFHPPEFFSSIVKWLERRHNWKISQESVCFCPGIVPALNLCILAFTRPGESVIVQPPVYFPFFQAVENHGRNIIYNQLLEKEGKWFMDFDSLIASINDSTKMLILSNPHNPVGRAWTEKELNTLAGICLKNNIIILSDEIHCDLLMPAYKHIPVAGLSDNIAEITVTCLAPSKTFNLAGLSTSSVIISNPVLRKYFKKKIESLHLGNGNIFGTEASIAAYSEGEKWPDALMEYVHFNSEFVMKYCLDYIPEITAIQPEATYMIWLDCRKTGMTGRELHRFLVDKAGVGLSEGSIFGPGGEGFMRMNLATNHQTVKKAMEQIRRAFEQKKEEQINKRSQK